MTRERKLWAAMDHVNIVPLYGYAEDESKFGPFGALISPVRFKCFYLPRLTVLQWYENGDASQFLRRNGKEMDVLARSKLVSILCIIILRESNNLLVDGCHRRC
jgi:hypothetical protein